MTRRQNKNILINYLAGLIFLFVIVPVLAFITDKEVVNTVSHNSTYPDSQLTPGDTFTDLTLSKLCTKGYTQTVRNVSVTTKKKVYEEYGTTYPQAPGAYEVDHFIPLELGGSNDIKNLWLEPSLPFPGFHQKDIVENYLHDQVCKKDITLQEAQDEIRTDWYKVYKSMPQESVDKFDYDNQDDIPTN